MSELKTTTNPKTGESKILEDDYLEEAGFERLDEERDAHQSVADASDMDRGGPYWLRGVYRRGDVTITFEENVSTLESSGMKTTITHPQVCIVESPKGRVACSADDIELQLAVANDLS